MRDYNIRKPTEEELGELKEWLLDHYFDKFCCDEEDQAQDIIDNYFFVVIDNYISDCPDYAGRLLLCVYGCSSFRQCFGWVDGKLTEIKLDEQFY